MKLALGTAQFGLAYGIANKKGQVLYDETKAILECARASGVDTLDTAMAYGDSERRLGEIGVQGWEVVSKLSSIPEECSEISEWVNDAVAESLARLKVRSLYGLLLHRPQQLLERKGDRLYRALQQLKQDGLVRKVGASIYAPSELDALCNRYHLDLVQTPVNILDHRLMDTGWLSRLTEQGTEVHARSVFLQGLLLMKPSDRPAKFGRWTTVWSAWEDWLQETGLAPLQACLRYALSWPEISKVIVGVDSLPQLQEILAGAAGPLPQVPTELRLTDHDLLNPANWDSPANPLSTNSSA